MNLYGEILKKLEEVPCLAIERSFVGEEGSLCDMRCELKEEKEASEIGKEAMTSVDVLAAAGMWRSRFFRRNA